MTNRPPTFDAVKEKGATLVGDFALLATMLQQGKIIEALRGRPPRSNQGDGRGGAPVIEEWASKIGADGYVEDAIDAVALAKKLVGVR